jgi:hypothetical protein
METEYSYESFSEGTPIKMDLEQFSELFRAEQRLLTQQIAEKRFRQEEGEYFLKKFIKKINKEEKKQKREKYQQEFTEKINDPKYIGRFTAKRNRISSSRHYR